MENQPAPGHDATGLSCPRLFPATLREIEDHLRDPTGMTGGISSEIGELLKADILLALSSIENRKTAIRFATK